MTWDDVDLDEELLDVEVGTATVLPRNRVSATSWTACGITETLVSRCDLDERPFWIEENDSVPSATPQCQNRLTVIGSPPRAAEQIVRPLVADSWGQYTLLLPLDAYRAGNGEAA